MDRSRSFLLICFLALLQSFAAGQGQNGKDIIAPTVLIELGKPNVWTMEQAHYLLERNRARDLGIVAVDPGPLDANEVVGFRIDALKTLLAGQVQFDQVLGTKNSASLGQFNTDVSRFNQLRARQDQLRILQTDTASKLAAAQFDLTQLQAKQNPSQPDAQLDLQVKQAQAKVSELTATKAALDTEASATASALSSEPTLNLTSTLPTPSTANSVLGTNDTFQKLLSNVPAGLSQSKIQASIKLDNYINLQYEMVAKQLTLLRDEAGPTSRVIFLELPQSVYATQKFKPYPDLAALWGYHLVQTWWRIESVVTLTSCKKMGNCPETKKEAEKEPEKKEDEQQPKLADNEEYEQQERLPSLQELCGYLSGKAEAFKGIENLQDLKNLELCPQNMQGTPLHILNSAQARATQLTNHPRRMSEWGQLVPLVEKDSPTFYSLDLIPRQSALNVADAHSVSRSYGFAGLFGLLSGLGGQGRYERQHDQYDQFTQQEVFASAFGKGQRTFGWTFGPLPGTKRLASGLRTTYAVLVVPKGARFVKLKAYGCGYRRRSVPKNPFTYKNAPNAIPNPHLPEECITTKEFTVEVPNEGDNFYVDEIYYKPVASGQRTTVEIGGTFSPATSVLINGTPLQKVVSVGQPMIEQANFKVPDNAGDKGVQGVFELVGAKRLILSFVMPPDFAGTPRIALVSPSKEAVINAFSLEKVVDGGGNKARRALDDARPMFYQAPAIVLITPEFDPSTANPKLGATVRAQLFGQGFDPSRNVAFLLNGKNLKLQPSKDRDKDLEAGQFRVVDSTLIQAAFPRPVSSPWHIDYYQASSDGTLVAHATRVDDGPPELQPAPKSCKIVDNQKDDKNKTVTALTVQLTGSFFSSAYPPDVAKQNDNITISVPVLISPNSWKFQAVLTPKKSFSGGVIVLRGLDFPQIDLRECADFDKYAKP